MEKVRKLVNVVAISFLFQRIVLSLDDQTKLKKSSISAVCQSHHQLKCIFDDTKARGFCGIIPAHLLLGHRNATSKHQKADFKGDLMVWQKLCDTVDENSPLEGLPGTCERLLENQSGATKFSGSGTIGEDICEAGLTGYFRSIKEALHTCCSNGIRDLVGGLPTKCTGEETLLDGSCAKEILIESIDRFHLTETISQSNYFINIEKYLAEINRKTIQQILNTFWREKIINSQYNLGTLVFTLPRLKSKIYVHQVNLNSLSRFDGYGSVLYIQNAPTRYTHTITDPVQLLGILTEELISMVDLTLLKKLRLKLNSHILNAVLVNWHKYEMQTDLWHDSRQIYDNLIPKDLSDYSYKFEKFVSNGHPYYPFGKSKVGFSIRDILDYSPEFQPKIPLMLAACHKSVVGIETNLEDFDYSHWFAQQFPKEWNHWVIALTKKGINDENYVPLPIHPWQFTHSVEKMFVDLIDSQMLVPLEATIEASPTTSIRTLLSTRNLSAPYIKVPIGIHATSSLRTYPSDRVKIAPVVSLLMAMILGNESSISQKLTIMRDNVGLYLKTVEERAQHLTATFRENVLACCLVAKEIAIPVAALFEKLSATDTPLFVHLLQLAGCTTLKGAIRYFTQYVELVVGGYLDLYLLYGIALEGHQQNTMAIFENNRIKRFVAKDLTETKIVASVSKTHPFLGRVTASSFFKNFNDFVVRAQLLHSVYQLHLGELLLLVAEHFGCPETLLWHIVADKTRERFEALEGRVDGGRWRNEYDAIMKADWPGRSYLQNHFESRYVEKYLYHFVENPLNSKNDR